MAWTTPTVRATGELITSSIWNTDLTDNLAYLKGEAGINIEFEDDIVPSAGSERCGLVAAPWDEGHFDKLFAGPRCAIHKFIREVVIPWESDADTTYQIDSHAGGGGSGFQMGGFGQAVISIDNEQNSQRCIYQRAEQNNALDTSFNASRSPYMRMEFSISKNAADVKSFLGFRQTPASGVPAFNTEKFAGLYWNGTIWTFQCADGTALSSSGAQTINVDTRYVIEILITSATSVECYLNGTLAATLATNLPTGDLEWAPSIESNGGGAGDTYLTLGQVILQEDLS